LAQFPPLPLLRFLFRTIFTRDHQIDAYRTVTSRTVRIFNK
jgi:hypothetical protein